jgi:hypothetical protein
MRAGATRPKSMLFSRPFSIDSALSATVARSRLRTRATSRDVVDLAAFRRRQIIGWRLSEVNESFLFQPEYGDSLSVDGARFFGLVEPVGAGSRIRGRIIASLLTRIVMSVWILAVAVASVVALDQGLEAPEKVLGISALMLGAAVLMVRYRLWSTSKIVEARLRQSLEASGSSVAA